MLASLKHASLLSGKIASRSRVHAGRCVEVASDVQHESPRQRLFNVRRRHDLIPATASPCQLADAFGCILRAFAGRHADRLAGDADCSTASRESAMTRWEAIRCVSGSTLPLPSVVLPGEGDTREWNRTWRSNCASSSATSISASTKRNRRDSANCRSMNSCVSGNFCNRLARPTEPIGLRVLRHDRSPTGGMEIFDRGDVLDHLWAQLATDTSAIWGRLYELRKRDRASPRHDVLRPHSDHVHPLRARHGWRRSPLLAGHGSARRSRSLHFTLHQAGSAALDKHPEGSGSPKLSVIPLGCELQGRSDDRCRRGCPPYSGTSLPAFGVDDRAPEESRDALPSLREARRLGVRDLPRLVLVGGIGVGAEALIDEIAADRRISERVVISPASRCRARRALRGMPFHTLPFALMKAGGCRYRKAWRAANSASRATQGALREAGEEFVDYLDPWDVEEWANRILRYLTRTRRAGAARARHTAELQASGAGEPPRST